MTGPAGLIGAYITRNRLITAENALALHFALRAIAALLPRVLETGRHAGHGEQ